ncbi:hypothetical protein GJR98_14925 [Haloferax sp. MBLA0077]|uniref:Solute-binding protein family 5 domain-containing protein n=2 Tax=Haloferax TaxID=2251 RepID=A0A6G1Z5T5_9EURY|nr:hypothetical protein Hfx1149_14970 [Haloferax sp. CBA1149]MRW81997.1 hypothetical protein [Haloferax marinisediminis]
MLDDSKGLDIEGSEPDAKGDTSTSRRSVNRRTVLASIGGAVTAGLAGCGGSQNDSGSGGSGGGSDQSGGSSGGGSQNLGERVPPLVIEYWTNWSQAKAEEDFLPVVAQNFEELGLTTEIKPVNGGTQLSQTFADQRTNHITKGYHESAPDRADPFEFTRIFAADYAGGNGRPNYPNWANCAYTEPALAQANAASLEERQKLINEAHKVMGEEAPVIPLIRFSYYYAARSDFIDIAGVGQSGMGPMNPHFYIQSEAKTGDSIVAGYSGFSIAESLNFLTMSSHADMYPYGHMLHSPLLEYDENRELQNMLASDYTEENEAKRFTFTLRDATFHNGDPITPEDVKFTFEQLNNNIGAYPKMDQMPLDSIETPDEKTVVFNFTDSYPLFITKVIPLWGILHKQTWVDAGAPEDPAGATITDLIGSGPFAVDDYEIGQFMKMVPHDGHPVHEPNSPVIIQSFDDSNSARQAFEAGEVGVISNIVPTILEQIKGKLGDDMEIGRLKGFLPHVLYPQSSFAPGQFKEFRKALGAAIDRQKISQIGYLGKEEPVLRGSPLLGNHPGSPPEGVVPKFTDDPTGDIEGAKALLEENGWGWDDNGNLHYPADADTSPLWPKGEEPDTGEFPCLSG